MTADDCLTEAASLVRNRERACWRAAASRLFLSLRQLGHSAGSANDEARRATFAPPA